MPRDDRPAKSAFERLLHTHRRIEERLAELEVAAHQLETDGAPPARAACENVMGFFARAVARHEADEEETVFPRLEHDAALAQVARALTAEHERQKGLVQRVAEGLAEPALPPWFGAAVKDVVASYRRHIEVEERDLFPAAERILDPVTKDRMASEMETRRGGGGRNEANR